MLEFMRRKAKSVYIQVAIVAIILVFVFWGVGTNQNGGPNTIATVNGQSIPYQQYRKKYDQTIDRYRAQLGGNLPAGLLKGLGIKQQVLNNLIQEALMQQGAVEAGLLVSNEEVRKSILEMESFRENGIFNNDRYTQLLSSSKLTKAKFETGIRNDMLNQKTVSTVSRFARISESELKDRFSHDNDQIKLDYVTFKSEDFQKKITPTDEDLAAFFQENGDSYKTATQVKLKFLSFSHDQAAASIQFTDEEIKQFYQLNIDKYSTAEQRHARHILIKSEPQDSAEQKTAKRQKLESILAQAKAGKDFAILAKEHSEGPSGPNGGDLGFFGQGQMVPAFDTAVFALSEGKISDIVETQFGFHIIKLEQIKPAKVVGLNEVRAQIIAEIKTQKGKNLTFQLANQSYEGIIMAGSLDKFANESKSPLLETDFFTRSNPPKELASETALINTAFSLKKGELSSLLEGKNGYSILYITDIKAPVVPPLAGVKTRVKNDFIADRAKNLAQEAADKLLAAAKTGTSFNEAAKKSGAEVKTTPFYSRSKQTTSGLPQAAASQGLDLNSVTPYPSEATAAGTSFYVIRFAQVQAADEIKFIAQKNAIKEKLQQEKQIKTMEAWLGYLQSKADITINQELLQ